jgi:O-antigen/teichoic acid export membrane protein
MIFSNYFYVKIFNPDFEQSAVIFDIYLLLIVSRLTFPQTISLGLKETGIIFKASLIEIIVNAGFSILSVMFFGIYGVAFATVLAFYTEKLYLMFFLGKTKGISVNQYVDLRILMLGTAILYLVFFVKYVII